MKNSVREAAAVFAAVLIIAAGAVMIAYRKNGRLLEHYNDGGTGPMRLLVTTDSYGTRSVMDIPRQLLIFHPMSFNK